MKKISFEYNATSVAEYLDVIQKIEQNANFDLFFRGQAQFGETMKDDTFSEWKPSPSIFRDKRLIHEKECYTYAMTECADEFRSCLNHCEILSKMQHYGVPTRLMDITSNALVALFFCCVNEDGSDSRKDGVVYILVADKEHIKEYDSDTITILSSLPRFSLDAQDSIKEVAELALKDNDPVDYFNQNENKQVLRLLHEIRKEKPAFEPKIRPEHILDSFIFTPQKTNPRIIKQSGLFVLFGLNHKSVLDYSGNEDTSSPSILCRIKIESKNKPEVKKTLDQCGISLASMYPELYKVAEYLKNSRLIF